MASGQQAYFHTIDIMNAHDRTAAQRLFPLREVADAQF